MQSKKHLCFAQAQSILIETALDAVNFIILYPAAECNPAGQKGCEKMKEKQIRKLVTAALFAALICLATALFAVPLPTGGFANLGDCFVILCGVLLGSWWGAAAAGLGAALADLLLGYTVYAPATFLIKGAMALCVFALLGHTDPPRLWRVIVAAVTAECIMLGGYFVFEICLYGVAAAAADLIGNALQGGIGAAAATAVTAVLMRQQRVYAFLRRR